MSEIDELKSKVENLEQRVTYLEETIQTLADINKSNQAGKYIANRQRAMAVANLVNSATARSELNMQAQKNILQALEEEKAAADKRIKAAIQEAVASADGNTLAEDFTYREVDGGIEIQGYNGFDVGTLIIPEAIRGKPVVGIGKNAFQNLDLTEVLISDSVKYIEDYAFSRCEQLEKIRFSQNLIQLGGHVFSLCENLKELDLPSSLRRIGTDCFFAAGIEHIVIPQNLEVIPKGCFWGCSRLRKIFLNENLKKIEGLAFSGSMPDEIIVPKSVDEVDVSAFSCSGLRRLWLAFLGMTTKFSNFSSEISHFEGIIYCLPGSEIQKQARQSGLEVRPLSEFKVQER